MSRPTRPLALLRATLAAVIVLALLAPPAWSVGVADNGGTKTAGWVGPAIIAGGVVIVAALVTVARRQGRDRRKT